MTGHVLCVWGFRFGGSPAAAVAKGWVGFALLHAAFPAILAAAVTRWTVWLHRAAFLIVSSGAMEAVFRYPFLRAPVCLVLLGTRVLYFISRNRRR